MAIQPHKLRRVIGPRIDIYDLTITMHVATHNQAHTDTGADRRSQIADADADPGTSKDKHALRAAYYIYTIHTNMLLESEVPVLLEASGKRQVAGAALVCWIYAHVHWALVANPLPDPAGYIDK